MWLSQKPLAHEAAVKLWARAAISSDDSAGAGGVCSNSTHVAVGRPWSPSCRPPNRAAHGKEAGVRAIKAETTVFL